MFSLFLFIFFKFLFLLVTIKVLFSVRNEFMDFKCFLFTQKF